MTTAAKSGATRKGGAVRAVRGGKAVTYRKLKLKLPKELPATLLFDIAEIEVADKNPLPVFRLLRSLLGSEQFNQVRNEIEKDEADVADVGELVNSIFEQYGLTAGEAPASAES